MIKVWSIQPSNSTTDVNILKGFELLYSSDDTLNISVIADKEATIPEIEENCAIEGLELTNHAIQTKVALETLTSPSLDDYNAFCNDLQDGWFVICFYDAKNLLVVDTGNGQFNKYDELYVLCDNKCIVDVQNGLINKSVDWFFRMLRRNNSNLRFYNL